MTYVAHEQVGYFQRDKRVEVTRRLRYMPYAQAGWIEERGSGNAAGYKRLTMFSYSSAIFQAWYNDDGALFFMDTRCADAAINYSRTTSRQVTMAMRELGLSDRLIGAFKRAFTNGVEAIRLDYPGGEWVNADTGEVI